MAKIDSKITFRWMTLLEDEKVWQWWKRMNRKPFNLGRWMGENERSVNGDVMNYDSANRSDEYYEKVISIL